MSDPGDAGSAEDRGQREKEAADSSASSQHGSLVTHHPQGPHEEPVLVSFVPKVAEERINWASRLSTGLSTAISEAFSLAGGLFQLTMERDEKYEEVSADRDDDPVELQDIFLDATSTMEAEEGWNWEDDPVELQDIHLHATSTMEAEEGRKWARKGDDGWWSAISEAAPWAGVKFILTEERDEKYRGTYVTGYPEDDPVQLQDVLQDATGFCILSPFEFDDGTREFPLNDLQTVAQKCGHFLFLVESIAEVLQMRDKPSTVLVRLSVFGWPPQQIFSSYYLVRNSTPEERQVLETAERRALRAVRLIVEAAKSGKLNSLRVLRLNGVGLDDTGFQALLDVIKAGQFHSLTSLSLGANPFGSTSATALAHVLESGKLLRLKVLALTYSCLRDDACEAYEKAMSSGSLEALSEFHFQQNDLGDRGAQALARGFQSGRLKNLTKLSLGWNKIGDDGMVALATSLAAGRFLELRILDFRGNSFGAKGIHGLAKALESGNLNSLLKLSISNGERPEEDAKPLVMAMSINQALTMDLDFDSGSSRSGLRRQHKWLVERNSKYVQLLARAGESSGKEHVWVPTGAMVAEEGRKWAHKGDDGWWTAISEVAPWAGVKFFALTDENYEGSYLSGYREDDLIQLQDILRRARRIDIFEAFDSKTRSRYSLQGAVDGCEQFVFLVERLADALQTGDEPIPLEDIILLYRWWDPRNLCPHYSSTPTPEMKQVLEALRLRVLLAVRLIVEAAKSGKLNKMKYLDLFDVGLDSAGLQALSDVIKAGHFPCLIHLFLGDNHFGSKGAIALAQAMESRKLLGLEELALQSNNFGDDGCEAFGKALSSGNLEALRVLLLHNNDIGDRGAEALARGFQSGRVKKLDTILFHSNRIGDDGMFALATSLAAGKCPKLTELDVRSNPFKTKGIDGLAKALESGNLNSLLKLSISNGQRSELEAKPLVMALSVNQALTVDLQFDSGWFMSGLRRQHKQLVERNSKYVKLCAQAGGKFVRASFAKVYLCGNPEVGKTTLRKSMTETKSYLKSLLTWDREEPRTRGIEISTMTRRGGKDDKRDISLAFWDMAGQDEYHKLHSSFLSDLTSGKATIFLVVCTTQNIEKAEEELNYWLRFIASSVNQNVKNLRDVFVVVNKWGKNFKFNVHEWKHMVSMISMKFQGHLNIKVDPFIVDVREKPQVDCVADALVQHSREMLDNEMIPEICHFIQTDVHTWKETPCSFPVLSRAEFDQVLNRRGANWDDITIEAALVYLNEVGILIYINKDFPQEWCIPNKQLVVLEPNWFCREIVGNMFLTRDMGGGTGNLFRSKVNTKTGSILITLFKDHFQALLGLWDEINVHNVLTILLWVGFCYKGHNENLFIPALIDEDDTPGDRWYGGNLEADREGQWVMGYCVEHARDEKCLAPIALWHKFQVRLARTREFNDQYGDSDFVCGKYFVTFKARLMCVLVEVNAEKTRPTFDHIEVFVKPLLNCQMDDLDSNTRKQCQVDLASEVVEMLLDLWAQVCPGINTIQRVVWPWPSSQPRRPKANLVNDMEAASINKWVQEHGVGRILQRLVGGTPISGDQLLSTRNKELLLLSMQGNIQGGKSRLGEAMSLGIFSSDLLEGFDLNEE